MQDETAAWIEKLEGAVRTKGLLPVMEIAARREVISLMHAAERHDLASEAWRLIPIPRGGARRLSISERLREKEAEAEAKRR